MQQAGRGGCAGGISDSIVILPSSGGSSVSGSAQFPAPRSELSSIYSVEAQDEAALTEYLESSRCRRSVLAQHLDGHGQNTSCRETDSIFCDRCSVAECNTVPEDFVPSRGSGSGSGSG
jgi:superfamily II DNA helicase RecQ